MRGTRKVITNAKYRKCDPSRWKNKIDCVLRIFPNDETASDQTWNQGTNVDVIHTCIKLDTDYVLIAATNSGICNENTKMRGDLKHKTRMIVDA